MNGQPISISYPVDEPAFRSGHVLARLYGYLHVPEEPQYVQSAKAGRVQTTQQALWGIADDVIRAVQSTGALLIVGPDTTTQAIMQRLGLDGTLLGVDLARVDLVRGRRLVARDLGERRLMELIEGEKAKIVDSVIGGQGHIFGRGNQQISPRVIRHVGKQNILVVATKEKLASLAGRPLLVDTGNGGLNQMLSGYLRVTTGYGDYVMYKVGR